MGEGEAALVAAFGGGEATLGEGGGEALFGEGGVVVVVVAAPVMAGMLAGIKTWSTMCTIADPAGMSAFTTLALGAFGADGLNSTVLPDLSTVNVCPSSEVGKTWLCVKSAAFAATPGMR